MALTWYNGRKSNQNESSAWFDCWCWGFAKFTGVDHGEELDWLGPWMEVGILMGMDHGEVKELE